MSKREVRCYPPEKGHLIPLPEDTFLLDHSAIYRDEEVQILGKVEILHERLNRFPLFNRFP